MNEDCPSRRLPACLLAAALACSNPAPPPASSGQDEAALRRQYLEMQAQAMEQVQAWQPGMGGGFDPREVWAGRLEEFAREHPGTGPAADALLGAMELRVAEDDVRGFFAAYDLMLSAAPDAPGLQGAFAQVTVMRMVEAGGPGIMQTPDIGQKRRAWRSAVPRIVSDMERAIAATRNQSTIAAAHYTIGSTCYQMEADPARALEHFSVVADQHPTWTHAESAREYVRELESLSIGKPAPDFHALTLRGADVALSSLHGKVVLVDFWATWCQPCIDELPGLKRAYARYRGRGFTILGVNLDSDVEAVRRFVAHHRIDWPNVATGLALSDPLARAFAVQTIPMSYLLDRRGVIRRRALIGSDVERAVGEILALD